MPSNVSATFVRVATIRRTAFPHPDPALALLLSLMMAALLFTLCGSGTTWYSASPLSPSRPGAMRNKEVGFFYVVGRGFGCDRCW